MSIRKFKADYLFTGKEMLSSEAVLITDENGIISGVLNTGEAGEDIEIFEGIISPGFINTHCHIELSHMKGRIRTGTGLINFLTSVIKDRDFPEEIITIAMLKAAEEMFEAGIVAVGDICNTTDSILIKKNSPITWHSFIEVLGFAEGDAPARLQYAAKVLKEFVRTEGPLTDSIHHSSLSPHAPYSVSRKLFELINVASAGSLITLHNQESEAENDLYLYGTGQMFELYDNLKINAASFTSSGQSSLQTYLPWLNKPAALLLVHNTFTNSEDIAFVQQYGEANPQVYFCICINANRYIQSTNPPINLLRNYRCDITLGTDSYASNHQLNILEEMKTIHDQFPEVPLPEMLQWATLNGARALNMEDRLGSFGAGKQPGIVLINNITDQQLTRESIARRLL